MNPINIYEVEKESENITKTMETFMDEIRSVATDSKTYCSTIFFDDSFSLTLPDSTVDFRNECVILNGKEIKFVVPLQRVKYIELVVQEDSSAPATASKDVN